jgi:hemolysin III
MNEVARAPRYTIGEEIASSVIHGLGAVLATGGLVVLTVFASLRGDAWHVVSCSVFGASLVVLYTASTLYHSIQLPRAKAILRRLDHSAIYLLIAGTYTPFVLVNLRGAWGWWLFGIIWALAVVGIVLRTTAPSRLPAAGVVLYVAMGWAVIVATGPLLHSVAAGGLLLLLLGGLAYTGGLAFYGWRRLPYGHAVWHGFVLVGSVLHFFAVLLYVVPLAG